MIKFASYNIRKSVGTDRRRQPDRIMQILTEMDADVVALQEVDRRFGQRATTLSTEQIVDFTNYMPVRFGIREQSLGWHGNALLVKKGIEVRNSQRIELPAFEPRGAVLADVVIGGETVRVVGMHLGLIGNWRQKQAGTFCCGASLARSPSSRGIGQRRSRRRSAFPIQFDRGIKPEDFQKHKV